MKTVGEIISLKIKELNISQAELGRRILGLSGQQIGYYIKGKQTPSLDFAVKWYEIFHENLIDLMFEESYSIAAEPDEKYEILLKKVTEIEKYLTPKK